jgi:hypothetical protein
MMKLIFLHWLSFLFIPMLLHCSRLQPTDDSELTSSPATTSGSSAYIYYFRLFPNSNSGVISGSSITVTVPNGTDLTNLVAGFSYIGSSVTVGAISQVSGITANNFSVPVTYKVTGTTGTVREFTVTVLTSGSDLFPPVVSSLTVSHSAVSTFPTTVTLRVYYTDYGSGFASGTLTFCGPTYFATYLNSNGHRANLTLTNMGSYAEATFELKSFHEPGTWRVCSVYLTDQTGNYASYFASANTFGGNRYSFNGVDAGLAVSGLVDVSGSTADFSAPVLTSVTATPSSVSVFPTVVTMRAYYTETGSGFSSGYIALCSPGSMDGTGNVRMFVSVSDAGSYVQGTVTLQDYHASGTWRICSVDLVDNVGNSAYYRHIPSLSALNFSLNNVDSGIPMAGPVNVASGSPDITAPVMTSVSISPSSVRPTRDWLRCVYTSRKLAQGLAAYRRGFVARIT